MRRPRHAHIATDTAPAASWRDLAGCRDADTELFFPETGKRSAPAKAVCARCPVRSQCLTHALEVGERHGVWGGLSEDERRAARRQHLEAATG